MATPVFSAAGTPQESASSTTLTISHTLAAGETLFVMFNGGRATLATVASVTWNGSESMTEIGSATAGSSFRTCKVYGLTGGTTGTHDVVVTMNESCNIILGMVFTYTNVNTSSKWDGVQTANGNPTSTPTATVTSETNDLVVYALLTSEAYVSHTASNGTERSEQTSTNGAYIVMDRAGQTSTQVNGTLGASDSWGLVAFNLNATSAALSGGTTTNSARGLTTATVATTASGGTPAYTYQWERKTFGGSYSNVSGATSATLNDTGLTAGTRYVYRCLVTDSIPNTSYSTEKDVRTWTPVTEANVYFSPYNWFSDGSGTLQANSILPSSTYAETVNAGAYLKFKVTVGTGGNVVLKLDTSAYNFSGATASKMPRVFSARDKADFTSTLLAYSATTVDLSLGSGLSAGTYEFLVVFAGVNTSLDANAERWSTPNLNVKVNGIDIDYDASHPSQTLRTKRLIVYGDSLTDGVGALAAGDASTSADPTQSFGWLIAQAFDAEVGVISWGGQGYTRGINNEAASSTNPSIYNSTDANESWNKYKSGASRLVSGAFSPVPDYLWVISGHNDVTLTATPVTAVLDEMRTAAGSSCWIFACSNNVGTAGNAAAISSGVAAVADTAKTKYLAPTQLFTTGVAANRFSFDTSAHSNVRGYALTSAELIKLAQAEMGARRPRAVHAFIGG